jgi:hypothetical protein
MNSVIHSLYKKRQRGSVLCSILLLQGPVPTEDTAAVRSYWAFGLLPADSTFNIVTRHPAVFTLGCCFWLSHRFHVLVSLPSKPMP